ncbi:glycerate kinase [Arenibacter sp. GZD96]|uniref:glycerate kinase n=1 Tax=Aurantibrevibacter litoralis TaxID=3106030 RepID=UPI002AFED7C3|nr:glycerate kinase [Arenibacter sp. GZD-96]MEA1784852.1 glycerate kinase [Arenibacter sp. GZD-96]
MNILIAPDSFKECLSATAVAEHIAVGIRSVLPEAGLQKIPLADGGEGLLEAILANTKGKRVAVEVLDPLCRKIKADYGIISNGKTAIIEMAKASGIELLKESEKNPLQTTTYGTGQLIRDALDKGCTKLVIGIGGSATNDGGMGMIRALGAKFLDKTGVEIGQGGGSLNELHHIDLTAFDQRLKRCEVVVACDVSNPLTGENGASYVYGEQKGGNPKQLSVLDQNLTHYADVLKSTLGIEVRHIPGSGAAGGTGAALLAFMKGTLKPGIDLILETLQVEKGMQWADLVITGEGKIDAQTLQGKTIAGIARMAKRHQVPVIVITGKVGENIDEIYDLGVSAIFSIVNQPMPLETAIKQAPRLIENCVINIMKAMKIFGVPYSKIENRK